MKTIFATFGGYASNDLASWMYAPVRLCIRVHIRGIPGWTSIIISDAVIDDYGNLVRVD